MIKHLFSESSCWETLSEFSDNKGNQSRGIGESCITLEGEHITNQSWLKMSEIKRENNYFIQKISYNHYSYKSQNPELGIQEGTFDIHDNTVFSKYKIKNTELNGYEIIIREDNVCIARGALYADNELINTWIAKMTIIK